MPDSTAPFTTTRRRSISFEFHRIVGDLAARQHCVVTRAQLVAEFGVAPRLIDRRLQSGSFRRLHHGVYQVGPVAAPRLREMAAVLACGPRSALCRPSAAAFHGITPPEPPGTPVSVFCPGHQRRRPGIRIWRVGDLRPEDVTRIEGIPVTTPARTLVDLAATVGPRELERVIARAERMELTDRQELLRLLARRRGRRGAPILRALLERDAQLAFTRSEAEERFLDLARKAGLRPAVNAPLAGYEVDFLWRAERLVVEVDGYEYHSSPRAFERDRRRDADLEAQGYRVMRVTWRQLQKESEAVLARVVRALVRGELAAGDALPPAAPRRAALGP